MYSGYKKDDANDFLLGKRIEAKHIETEAESSANVSVDFSNRKLLLWKSLFIMILFFIYFFFFCEKVLLTRKP